MEPFSITCTTCKSRLKVKSQAAVGHLLKCPKCGGMVMVKLPEEPKPGDSASLRAETAPAIQKPIRPADAQDTLGENQDFDEVDALLASGAPKAMPVAAKSVAPTKTAGPTKTSGPAKTAVKDKPSRFAEGEAAPVLNGMGNGMTGVAVGAAANGKAVHPSAPAAKDAPHKEPVPSVPGSDVVPLPGSDWSSERPWRSWLFLAVSILLGMGLAFVVVAFSLSYFQDDTNVAVNPDTNPGGEVKPAETTPNPVSPVEEPAKKPAKKPTESPAIEKTPETPVSPEKTNPEKTKTTPTPPAEEDPLGIGKKPPVETKPAPPLANDPFSKIERLLGVPKDPTAPAPAETVPAPKPTTGAVEGPVKPSLPRPPARAVNVAARMNDAIPGLAAKADEVSLADFLQFMQDFSTIPITLEPDNLVAFNQTANSPLPAFDLENLKFGPALTAALAPLGLEAVVEDDQIIVRKPELTRDKETRELRLRLREYDMSLLTNKDEKVAAELAERIMDLIEPGSWGDDDDEMACSLTPGKESFVVRHRLSAHVQFLLLCEKLRVARGLKPLSTGLDADTFRLVTRTEKAAARLATPISLTFKRAPLVKVCQKLSADGKMRILIDWRGIAASGWNPDAEVTLVVANRPLAETLTALLEPMDLAYRVIDGRTIQIVAPQYLAEHLELELHPVKELVSGPEQMEPLLAQVRASLTEGAAEPLGRIWLDPESKCLVTMLPQPKQQLLTKLLGEWRAKGTD